MWKRANGRVENPIEFAVAEYLVINLSRKEIGISHWKLQNLADGHYSLPPVADGVPSPHLTSIKEYHVVFVFFSPTLRRLPELLIPHKRLAPDNFFLSLEPRC